MDFYKLASQSADRLRAVLMDEERRIAQLAVQKKLITPKQLAEVLDEARNTHGAPLTQIMTGRGLLRLDQVRKLRAQVRGE